MTGWTICNDFSFGIYDRGYVSHSDTSRDDGFNRFGLEGPKMENINSFRNQLNSTPEYLDARVVCQKLHVSTNTLKNWIGAGNLRGVKILKVGGITRFEKESFYKFLERNTREI